MDFSHHEFTGSNVWDIPNNPTMENHTLHHPFHFTQCPNYPPVDHHNLQEPSNINSSSDHLLAASKLLGGTNFGIEENQEEEEDPEEELGAMKEMMFKIAAMQPVDIDPATIRRPKRRNIRISNDPQSIAARHRRERISEKMRILQRLVPGGMTMDTASMLDEAAKYVKFLKRQIRILGAQNHQQRPPCTEPTIATASAELDWVAALKTGGGASSYLFGGNNNSTGPGGEYPSFCFNPK